MSTYIGIDLGTTNSALCSYDGAETRIWKSPEQNDVTPSAISYDRRGNRLVGQRAYQAAAANPDNAAVLFKRLMGTSTPIHIRALGKDLTPEECSAEVLRTLFSYLPEEIRNAPDLGTVITVPAAFNQMQRDATTEAARMAGIGRVALMQEPVAAVMSVMKAHQIDDTFLIYDLGGGTLDIAIAQSTAGRVSLLSHGGIALCGGRDFDRRVRESIVKPWLTANFDLPEDFSIHPKYRRLMRMAALAVERAKIELSAKDSATISLSEAETQCADECGSEIYIDCDLTRDDFNQLIADCVDKSITAAREAIQKAGLSPFDIERIVFIGGPTNYKPLRDKVCQELGVEGSTEVNPMTAVAEGAAIFAESIDWTTKDNARKSSKGSLSTGGDLKLTLNYIARTPETSARVMVQSGEPIPPGCEFQIDSLDTGWTSGRVPLAKKGKKVFKAARTLKAGSNESINIKIWEGEIEDPITDNRPIGVLKIEGDDFENGIIETGADLICEYEIDDSGTIRLEVSVPSVSGVFSAGHNFYSRQESAINYSDAAELVVNDADSTLERVKRISDVVIDPELDRLTRRLTRVRSLNPDKAQTEDTQEAMETVLESRRKLASIRKAHLKEIRQAELDDEVREFNDFARADANPTEIQSFEYQQQAAQRIIDRNEPGFEGCLRRIRSNTFRIGGVTRSTWSRTSATTPITRIGTATKPASRSC